MPPLQSGRQGLWAALPSTGHAQDGPWSACRGAIHPRAIARRGRIGSSSSSATGAGDRFTATLYRDVIEPDEHFRSPAPARSCSSDSPPRPTTRSRPPRRPRHHVAGRRDPARGPQDRPAFITPPAADGRRSVAPRACHAGLAARCRLDLARTALTIAGGISGARVDAYLGDSMGSPAASTGRGARPSPGPPAPASRIPLRGARLRGQSRGLLRPCNSFLNEPGLPPRSPSQRMSLVDRATSVRKLFARVVVVLAIAREALPPRRGFAKPVQAGPGDRRARDPSTPRASPSSLSRYASTSSAGYSHGRW